MAQVIINIEHLYIDKIEIDMRTHYMSIDNEKSNVSDDVISPSPSDHYRERLKRIHKFGSA